MKDIIRGLVRRSLNKAIDDEIIETDSVDIAIEVSRTKNDTFGDYAVNTALVLAKKLKRKPKDIAEMIRSGISDEGDILEKIEIAGPGFLNFFISKPFWRKTLVQIHEKKEAYGSITEPRGSVLLEFVSANPTGPLHVGHGRGAAVGDALARLLRFCGREVKTEYYVNDSGNQMKILGRSLLVRLRQLSGEDIAFPENHYQGDYMLDMAKELLGSDLGNRLLSLPDQDALPLAADFACGHILDGIKDDLAYFGVSYDNWFSEKTLHDSQAVQDTLNLLKEHGKAEEKEGALWFSMEGSEDDRDRVLVRATGEPTYFAADAAYHLNKIRRGFHLLVDIWGSDHHGYVPRVKAAISALGYNSDVLQVMLVQFVTLVREGQKISMSTRSGQFITLREVLNEVGSDAARFFFLTKRSDSHLDFDLDLAKKQSRDNPVYYVQYAHARICSIFRIASERDIPVNIHGAKLDLLSLDEEMKIVKQLADFPDMLSDSADALEPHRITFYLVELADAFHSYYHDNRIIQDDQSLMNTRLFLVDAVRQVLSCGLGILGVSAPERM